MSWSRIFQACLCGGNLALLAHDGRPLGLRIVAGIVAALFLASWIGEGATDGQQ